MAGEARRDRDAYLAFDEVWCVFDRDDHERFREAIDMARGNGLELAVSNPSFELWILLHLRESPGERHRDDIRRMLRDVHLPTYDKAIDERIFDVLRPGIPDAVRRARRLAEEAAQLDEDPFKNPTTGVFLLLESLAPAAWPPGGPST